MRYISAVVGGSVVQRSTIVERWTTRSISRIRVEQKKTNEALFDGKQLDILSGKGSADVPFSSFQVEFPLAVDLEHPGTFRLPCDGVSFVTAKIVKYPAGWAGDSLVEVSVGGGGCALIVVKDGERLEASLQIDVVVGMASSGLTPDAIAPA